MKKKTLFATVTFVVLVAVAVAVNWKFSLLSRLTDPDAGADPAAGSAVQVSADVSDDSYFDNARYTRTQSRQEAVTILNSIINDPSVDEQTRKNAMDEVTGYARITESEASLENVIKSKGFDDCVVFLTADTATVVVSVKELTAPQSAQIFDAVVGQTGFDEGAVKIVTYAK